VPELPVVVIVSEGPSAGGVSDRGLGVHTGRTVVIWFDVTTQLNVTGLSKPSMGWRSIIAVEVPPGSTDDG
jgi:hypothetical protein